MKTIKRMAIAALAAVLASTFPTSACAASHPTTVRSMSDLRIWQTAMDPSEPLKWPWELDSNTAILTLSNRLTGAKSTATVAKSGDELYGSCAVPAPASGKEAFYAAELVLRSGSAEVARYTADIAYVDGVPGRPITIRSASTRDWSRFSSPALTTYDAAWTDTTGPATLTASSGGIETTTALPGESGYAVISSQDVGACRFDLGFDGMRSVWSASLKYIGVGLTLLIQ